MKSPEIRQRFIEFFKARQHEYVASSSLIPAQDPTLLFTNAGMNQFKDLFLGREKRNYKRAVSIQKCVRAGGKHNDLDNVGFTKRHLTFFEMMGNFSFGDYFKQDAIIFAWDFLTKDLGMKTNNLHATVYTTDDEAYDIWHTMIGIPKERMHRLGEEHNFWQMGDLGPCGPSTEIHIDRGAEFGCKDASACGPACDCDRFLEIWNLVFMQYDRQPNGELKNLEQTGVDTGMGFERLAAVMQDKDSVFEIDTFAHIIKKIEELSGRMYAKQEGDYKAAFHVLADHIRSSSFLIADGCAPSNEGRGYVLRKIIRRAALFAQKLTSKNIFPELSRAVVEQMGDVYPELKENADLIFKVLESEISKFATNLVRGQGMLNAYFTEHAADKKVTGTQAFKMYDTYGFPLELVEVMAHERGFTVDKAGFEKEMLKQQEQSGKKLDDPLDHIAFAEHETTEFTGYQELETTSDIIALVVGHDRVEHVPADQVCYVVAKRSPFFIVGGGQVPDQGWLNIGQHRVQIMSVRYLNDRIAAQIKAPVDLELGMQVTEIVDPVWRTNAMKNHTATHLLQSALIQLFGKHIKQSGSLVHPDYLRFDFTYHENLNAAQIKQVEDLVNEKIRLNIPVSIEYMTLAQAQKRGALAFFGDKYNPEQVRMVIVPDFSMELCGGTHVPRTGDIGVFKITEVGALSAGHRRIVAVTGPRAVDLFQDTFNAVKTLSTELRVKKEDVVDAALKNKDTMRELTNQMKTLKQQLWHARIPALLESAQLINGVPFLYSNVGSGTSHEELRDIATQLAYKKAGIYFLVSEDENNRALFLAYIAAPIADRIKIDALSAWLKDEHGLRGGGSKLMIQGGAPSIDARLKDALASWLHAHIAA